MVLHRKLPESNALQSGKLVVLGYGNVLIISPLVPKGTVGFVGLCAGELP